jgi:regulator of sigma E protease
MKNIGFKTGDKIVSIDGKQVEKLDGGISERIMMSKSVTIDRNGIQQDITIPKNFIDQLLSAEKIPLAQLRMPFTIAKVPSESKNQNLKKKDLLVSLNGQKTKYADEVKLIMENNKGKTLPAVVLRDQKEVSLTLKINEEGKLGVIAGGIDFESLEKLGYYKVSRQEYGLFQSIPVGVNRGFEQLGNYWKQLKAIFNPSTGAYKGVGGFAAIFNIFPKTWSWEAFWSITALLSIMLGVMNLLPIPALDGGHVMFLLYEMISGRKPSDKFLEKAQMVGFVLLISLLLFANGNDIYKAIFNK